MPAVAFFLALQAWHALWNFRLSRRMRLVDPQVSDLHLLVFAYVVSYTVAIYFGSDLNDPMIWAFLALGVLARRLAPLDQPAPQPVPLAAVSVARVLVETQIAHEHDVVTVVVP